MAVNKQARAHAVMRAYARPSIGWRLVPSIVDARDEAGQPWRQTLVVRAVRDPHADCYDKASRLELIREVDRRIRRLRTIFRLLAELRYAGVSWL